MNKSKLEELKKKKFKKQIQKGELTKIQANALLKLITKRLNNEENN